MQIYIHYHYLIASSLVHIINYYVDHIAMIMVNITTYCYEIKNQIFKKTMKLYGRLIGTKKNNAIIRDKIDSSVNRNQLL